MEIDIPAPSSSLAPLPLELSKLSSLSQGASQAGLDAVSSLIAQLEAAKARLSAGDNPANELSAMRFKLAIDSQAVERKQKEWSGAIAKFGKSVDKKFATPLEAVFPPPASQATVAPISAPTILSLHAPTASTPPPPTSTPDLTPGPFSSPEAASALNETIALHLARIGAFSTLDTFIAESNTAPVPANTLRDLKTLHAILGQLGKGECKEALRWIDRERSRGREVDAGGELEFALRREEFIRLLLHGQDLTNEPLLPANDADHQNTPGKQQGPIVSPQVTIALQYGNAHFNKLCTPTRLPIISALFTSTIFLPLSRLLVSPYASIYNEYVPSTDHHHAHGEGEVSPPAERLQAMFAACYLKQLGLPRESPLSVVTDVGGGGALARIQKVRNVMREKKTEWSAKGELPVEIPLPSQYRFHSIFACPVSKEQATESNPPMLLPCGHVIARESLNRLARGTASVKCPYCPVVSTTSAAVRVHF